MIKKYLMLFMIVSALLVGIVFFFSTNTTMIGEQLPDFTLENERGELISSVDIPKPLVLFFYPKNDTPVCTKEACFFRDYFKEFERAGVTIYGISKDSIESHKIFLEKHSLPYGLLSDPKNKVRDLLKVKKFLGLIPARVTFIIYKEGKIIHIFDSPHKAEEHVLEALTALGISKKD